IDTLFLMTFSLFILVAIATFISMEMRRSEREAVAAGVPSRQNVRFHSSLAGISAILGVLTLAGAALIFFILPRLSSSGYLRSLGIQDSLVTGFSHDVSLGGIGQIQQSSNVVMHIQVLDGTIPEDVKWRGIALANFDGRRWFNAPELPIVHGLSDAG